MLTFLNENDDVWPPLHSFTGIRLRWIPTMIESISTHDRMNSSRYFESGLA